MALELLTETYNCEFSGNSIYKRFSTDNYIEVAGVKAKWEVGFSGIPTIGVTFGFESNLLRNSFIFSSSTNVSGINHYIDIVGSTLATVLSNAANTMNSFADFSLYYIATSTSDSIIIEAKETGIDYDMFSRGISGCTTVSYIDAVSEVLRKNYKLVIQLERVVDNSIISVLQLSQYNGIAEVDLSSILHSTRMWFFEHHNSYVKYDYTDFVTQYTIKYAESFGEPPYQGIMTNAGVFNFIPAKIDSRYFNDQTTPKPTIASYVENKLDYILTVAPRINRRIDTDQNDYLFYYCKAKPLKVKFTSYFNDGTSSFVIYNLATSSLSWYRVTVNLAKCPGDLSKVDSFLVDFLDSENAVVTSISYEVDRDYYIEKKYWLFQNSLWGIDTFTTTGKNSETESFKKDIASYIGQFPVDKKQYQYINKVTVEQSFQQFTGWLTKGEVDVFLDMLRSEHVMLLDNGTWRKVNVFTDKISNVKESQKGLFGFSFEYSFEMSL